MRPSTLFFQFFFWIGTGCLFVSTRGETTPTKAWNLINDPKKHLVTVFYKNDSKEIIPLCLGVQIQPNYFITSASCFDSFRSPDTGRLSIKKDTIYIASVQRPDGSRVPVVGVLEHPDYTVMIHDQSATSERRNDLAILRVDESLDNKSTTNAILPFVNPKYGAPFYCSVIVFKDKMHPHNLVGLKGDVIPTKDCVSDERGADDLKSLFCLQLKKNPKIKKEYITGAPVACLRYNTYAIYGIISWGYEPNSKINNLLVTSLATQQKWIREHEDETFLLPYQPGSTPETSTISIPTSRKPTSDPGQSIPTPNIRDFHSVSFSNYSSNS